jgi:hypothetical protein
MPQTRHLALQKSFSSDEIKVSSFANYRKYLIDYAWQIAMTEGVELRSLLSTARALN